VNLTLQRKAKGVKAVGSSDVLGDWLMIHDAETAGSATAGVVTLGDA
jgi:hypothetical protein